MKKVAICDTTLKNGYNFSFKEKLELIKQLDRLCVDVIEAAPLTEDKKDTIFLHTSAPLIRNSIFACPTGLSVESVSETYDAIKEAAKKRLIIPIPVSTVQMEYHCHMKADKMAEHAEKLIRYATELCGDVEVSFIDATRAEPDFLSRMTDIAVKAGAKTINVCDTAGILLPEEAKSFIADTVSRINDESITVSAEFSDEMRMANACLFSAIPVGLSQIKVSIADSLCDAASVFRTKGDSMGITCSLELSEVYNTAEKLRAVTDAGRSGKSLDLTSKGYEGSFKLESGESIETLKKAVKQMGYDLSSEDLGNVYNEYLKISALKAVGPKELDAIIASVALQVPPTYSVLSYVTNSGNILTPTAHIKLSKNGKEFEGLSSGDGPIDAAFLAIEQIAGRHYELDDFQIFSVTEGREAMGSAIVKLRYEGKLYSGKGISTDIVGASINAYISALNKICYEEEII